MRVIAGTARGRRLVAPKGVKTRPTADRVKENLFNIITARVAGAAVLDLYAGTGSLAIEALSRGANSAVLVEDDKAAIEAIERNLEATKLSNRAVLRQSPVRQALARLVAQNQAFDLILLDPPYKIDESELEIVLEKAASCLNKPGLVVLEHRSDLPEIKLGAELFLVDRRRYGDTALSFYEKRES